MRIDGYDWAGGREAMLRFGPDIGPVLVVAMPLLEEWNRTRAFTVALLRTLAERGISSVLPDLPGHGESALSVGDLTVPQLAEALKSLTERLDSERRTPLMLSIRSGALITSPARTRASWSLSPMTGADLLTDLHRTWLAADRSLGQTSVQAMIGEEDRTIAIAGQSLSTTFLRSLASRTPSDQAGVRHRTVRLATDRRPADRHVEGPPLWRRSEPGNDPALVHLLADDIQAWVKTCAA